MRFAFTEEQLALRDGVREVLRRECTPGALRDAWENPTGRIPELWNRLVDLGVPALLAPEAAGGLGLGWVDLVLVLEETGAVALPEPIVETAAVAVPFLAAHAPEVVGAFINDGLSAAVTLPESPFPVWADSTDVLITITESGVRVVPRAEYRRQPIHSVDGARRLFEVEVPAGFAPVGGVGAAADAFRGGALGTAAQLLGLTDTMITMTVEYAKTRRQFGVPIGSFQAVKHHLADARVALEFARPLVYRAAWSLATEDPARGHHVAMAKAQAGDAALRTARAALQCHGAIGYTTEYDLHRFMKRAWALAAAWGDGPWHRRSLGRAIL